jgi:HlyD family secretion protein
MRGTLIGALAVIVVGGSSGWFWYSHRSTATTFRTAEVQTSDLRVTISATGTVEPEEVVDIGAQVQGQIKSLGQDPQDSTKTVDYDSEVEQGTVLARIDDALYAAEVDNAKAAVEAAKANQEKAEADLVQMKAKFTQADRDFTRAKDLVRSPGALTPQDYDQYLANYESTKAAVAVGEATIALTKRTVTQTEAVLKKAQTNLDYCTVKSPVKGVIVDRRVNVGQTVVSSLNAPSLFLIAKDLKRLQVWVSVNEADIGQIRAGQPVTFTVDAYPKDMFKGTVNKIRLNATMTNNVVTYTVEVSTDNSDLRLKPYLTANVQFEVGVHKNVLTVPNAAVQWRPQQGQIAPDVQAEMADKGRKKDKDKSDGANVWVQDGDHVRPLKVHIGWTDGVNTEIQGDGLTAGTKVVIGDVRPSDNGGGSNPFAPKMFSSGGNKGGS